MAQLQPTTRPLFVLGAFKPFGLSLEHLDSSQDSSYALFDPHLARSPNSVDPLPDDNYDEELFIHGNCVVWSSGNKVQKRFSAPSAVIQAVWCRFDSVVEPLLCVLYSDCLAIFTPAGEMTIVPLPHAMESLWPIPFGLLLQRGSVDSVLSCKKKNISNENGGGRSPLSHSCLTKCAFNFTHFSLQHPLEEPQTLWQGEDDNDYNIIDPAEQIIWTSNDVLYVVTYHNVKQQHSIWHMNLVSRKEVSFDRKKWSQLHFVEGSAVICMKRLWQDEGNKPVADKVFLATDSDNVPILCFLMKHLQILFAFKLIVEEKTNLRIKMAWSIHAVAAAPIVATRPWLQHPGKQFDQIILTSDGSLFLHRGMYCLCQLYFPWNVVDESRYSVSADEMPKTPGKSEEIIDISDPVQGRVNLITSSGQLYRCSVTCLPASAITMSCLRALDEGLENLHYYQFLSSLWKHDYLGKQDLEKLKNRIFPNPDLEWESFANMLMLWCNKGRSLQASVTVTTYPAWDYLLSSTMHRKYRKIFHGLSLHSFSPLKYESCFGGHSESFIACGEDVKILGEILTLLHVVYEDHKLDCLRWRELHVLASLLIHIAAYLHEWNYVDHYARDFPDLFELFKTIDFNRNWQSLNVPFNVFKWLESCMKAQIPMSNILPSLYLNKEATSIQFSRKVIAFYEMLSAADSVLSGFSSGVHVHLAPGSFETPEQKLVLAMVGENFSLADLDRLPAGVSLPLRHVLNNCRETPPCDWPQSAFVLIGREDLASMCNKRHSDSSVTHMAAPYMLHLHPMHLFSSENDSYDNANTESISSDDSLNDGMEHLYNGTIQLRFGRDLRLNEVRRLLCSSRPVAVRMANPPDVSDPDIVAQQQAQLWQLAQRTTSLSFGRGAFTLATMQTVLTEVLTIPKLVLAGRLPSQHDATVNLDSSTGNLSDLTSWPEFHNGVAAGLRLAPCQDKVTRTWIVYNRPEEPSFAHAGLLMSLGLQGHLRVLAATDVYRYLSQEHEATTVGILLGMAAAYRGTMDPAISKILYLHIPARHPPSFPELELPTLMQSAALMAVGMLYQGSAHRLTTEILLAEIGRKPGSDNVLEREGYALAAGLALGLVTLGKGKSAWGLADLSIEEHLLYYMSGGSDPGEGCQYRHDGLLNNSMNSGKNLDDFYQNNGQVMEGSIVNLDVTAPGAILALGLMFLKTNNQEVAARLATPDTHFALEYVRPDFILLRVVARNLILWDSVQASEEWVQAQIPGIIKEFLALSSKDKEDSDLFSVDVDMEALAQAHVNVLAGACLSIGLRFAGTANADAQQLLYGYALYFLREKRSAAAVGGSIGPNGRSSYVDRSTWETCLNVAVLSLSVVMAGSGHLDTFKLLRYLRRRNDGDGGISYGNHTAISMAIGFLFLGGGTLTFSTNNSAIAALLIALYPRLSTAPNDHRCHLQAFRHLYVLAAEPRCIQTIDVDTGLPVYAPLEITMQETLLHAETSFCQVSPCLLPERCLLKRVRVCGPRYWCQDITLSPSDLPWWHPSDISNPFPGGVILVKRKVGARTYHDDPIGRRSLLSHILQKNSKDDSDGDTEVDKVVSTFSADPSLLAFAQFFCTSRQKRMGNEFQQFCLQTLLECVSADKPAVLQAYLSFYTIVEDFIYSAKNYAMALNNIEFRSLYLYSLKIAVAYNEAFISHILPFQGEPLLQQTFLSALSKQIDGILDSKLACSQNSGSFLVNDLVSYMKYFQNGQEWKNLQDPFLLSVYLQWYDIPYPALLKNGLEQLSSSLPLQTIITDSVSILPFLALLFPGTATRALIQVHSLLCSREHKS